MMNFQKMMQQAQQMQYKLQEMQEKFADLEVEGEAGGGLVTARMNCKGEMLGINIDPTVFSGEKEMAEDLIVAAINNANLAKDERVKTETQAMMEELGLPAGAADTMGGGGMPFGG